MTQETPREMVWKDDAPGDTSDGHHTFTELYAHRRALTAALAAGAAVAEDAWRSKAHHPDDDPMFDGCFIVGIELPTGTITYHYKIEFWDDFATVPELEHAPKWDGAGPDETITRLLGAVATFAAEESEEVPVEEITGDAAEGKALHAFADGQPYVFVVADLSGEGIGLRVASEHDTGTVKAILARTLDALG